MAAYSNFGKMCFIESSQHLLLALLDSLPCDLSSVFAFSLAVSWNGDSHTAPDTWYGWYLDSKSCSAMHAVKLLTHNSRLAADFSLISLKFWQLGNRSYSFVVWNQLKWSIQGCTLNMIHMQVEYTFRHLNFIWIYKSRSSMRVIYSISPLM